MTGKKHIPTVSRETLEKPSSQAEAAQRVGRGRSEGSKATQFSRALPEGHKTITARVTGDGAALDYWAAMTAQQRGAVVLELYQQQAQAVAPKRRGRPPKAKPKE